MDPSAAEIVPIVTKILSQSSPWWWLGALCVLVGVPTFLLKVPETIKAISSYHDTHRKTSHKIAQERQKLEKALTTRQGRKAKPNKGTAP